MSIEVAMWVGLIASSDILAFLLAASSKAVERIFLLTVGGGVRGTQEGRANAVWNHP
jgi:hypothetical protein